MAPPCCAQHRSGPGDNFLSLIGLFYRASQRWWQLQRWLSLACFHYKPWHLISLREMGSERWGTRVAKPSFSVLDDTLRSSHWCEKCLCVPTPHSSCFCPFCVLLKTQRFGFLHRWCWPSTPKPQLNTTWTLTTVTELKGKIVFQVWVIYICEICDISVTLIWDSVVYIAIDDISIEAWAEEHQGLKGLIQGLLLPACLQLSGCLWKCEKVWKSRCFTSTSIDTWRCCLLR